MSARSCVHQMSDSDEVIKFEFLNGCRMLFNDQCYSVNRMACQFCQNCSMNRAVAAVDEPSAEAAGPVSESKDAAACGSIG